MASFSVVSNLASANAQAHLQNTNINLNKALTRLSSGFRINNAGDDAAGLAVANTYRNQQAILTQGVRNANDAMSKLQIKDGALNNIATLLDRLATLATQAGSPSNGVDISKLSDEYAQVVTEITREATVGEVATASASFSVFVSSETAAGDGAVTGTINSATATGLGLSTTSFSTAAAAQAALTQVKNAIDSLGDIQNTIGTLQNKLSFAINLSQTHNVNTKAAESRIRDANIAEESANMTRFNILSQSGIAALAQANQTSSSVLSLLK